MSKISEAAFAAQLDTAKGQIVDAQNALASLTAQQVAVQAQIDDLKKTAQNILS
jgi:cell division protein FtsB